MASEIENASAALSMVKEDKKVPDVPTVEERPSDWLERLNDERPEYLREDDNWGGIRDGYALSPDHRAVAVFSPEEVANVEDFTDSCERQPWYVPDTYVQETEVPDSLEDEGNEILAGESQPLEPLEDIELEIEASMIAKEEEEGEVEEDEGDDIQLNFGVKLDSGELQVIKDTLKILLPTYRP